MEISPDLTMNLGPAAGEDDLVELLRHSAYPDADLAAIKHVIAYCRAVGLDPLHKPVHLVPLWDAGERETRHIILPGIGLYRMIAARAGCAGVDEPEFGPDLQEQLPDGPITYPAWCRVTVHRRLPTGEIVHFTAREFWQENVARASEPAPPGTPNEMWRRRPYGQLAKCAEAQALRKGFPEIGAVPSAEEMEGKLLGRPARGHRAPTHKAPVRVSRVVGLPHARRSIQSPHLTPTAGTTDPSGFAPVPEPSQHILSDAGIETAPDQQMARGRRRANALHTSAAIKSTAVVAAAPRDEAANAARAHCDPLAGDDTTDTCADLKATPFLDLTPAGSQKHPSDPADPAGHDGTMPVTSHASPMRTEPITASVLGMHNASEQDRLASRGERAYLLRSIDLAGMSVESAWAAAQLPPPVALDALTCAQFQALLRGCA
jgi:phage recombination protein Bet